jgi:transposase-like protein
MLGYALRANPTYIHYIHDRFRIAMENALKDELDEHLGYERHAPAGRGSGNSHNG